HRCERTMANALWPRHRDCGSDRCSGCGTWSGLPRMWRSPAPRRRAMRVLVIDDDPLILEVYAHLLSSLGHSVTVAAGGAAGIAALQAGEPMDLVITDLRMPGRGGWDVVRAVRERWPSLRVGVISGDHESIALGREPVDFLLTKPIDRDTFKMLFDL